jgi:hypothetical protein
MFSRLRRTYLPWAARAGRAERGRRRGPLAAPFVCVYLAVSWAIFLPNAARRNGKYWIDEERVEPYLYRIPDLSERPLHALGTLVTAPWLNHDSEQIVYVTVLLLLFGLVFEANEGTRTTLLVFFGTTFAGALGAGMLLHVIYPDLIDTAFFARAWARTWSGGSAGAFGLMGALAARTRRPWPLLALFLAWETYVAFWQLHQYTPAFHLTALLSGFVALRYAIPQARRRWYAGCV